MVSGSRGRSRSSERSLAFVLGESVGVDGCDRSAVRDVEGHGIPQLSEEDVGDAQADDGSEDGRKPPVEADNTKHSEGGRENADADETVRDPRFHLASVGSEPERRARA